MASAANLVRLSHRFGQDDAAWAFGQWELRKRGLQKFARAEEMLFTREALEQASHEVVAVYHASLFSEGELVLDCTAGIGGDLIALAKRGQATGCELDQERAQYARHNLAVHGLEAEIEVQDALAFDQKIHGVFADPARRVQGRRVTELSEYEPNPFELASRFGDLRFVMKLSPMLSDEELGGFGAQVQFVEFKRECREALLVFGEPPGSWAVDAESRERLAPRDLTFTSDDVASQFAEASPAAIRGHCLGHFGLAGLGDSNGYLTGDGMKPNPWLTIYPVLWSGRPADVPKELKTMQAETPEIKQRGAGQDLIQLRKKWRSDGDLQVIVALYPVGKSLRAVILGQPISE